MVVQKHSSPKPMIMVSLREISFHRFWAARVQKQHANLLEWEKVYGFHLFFQKLFNWLPWWHRRNSTFWLKSNILNLTGLIFEWLKRFCIKCCLIINYFWMVTAFFYFITCTVILDLKLWQLMGMWSNLLSHAKCLEWPKDQRQLWTKLWSWRRVFTSSVGLSWSPCFQAA